MKSRQGTPAAAREYLKARAARESSLMGKDSRTERLRVSVWLKRFLQG